MKSGKLALEIDKMKGGFIEKEGEQMTSWFQVDQLAEDTYAISEYKHWEETHCYLLCGSQRAVLIDTGLGVASIRQVVTALTDLPIEVLTTHVHWDHIGGHADFAQTAVFPAEEAWLAGAFPLPLAAVKKQLARPPCDFPPEFELDNFCLRPVTSARLLGDGEMIDLGGRGLQVLHTPGHSPGHCCFYEEARGALYAGDLLYQGCLDAFYPTTDPMLFKQSVERVSRLAVSQIWPGHHQLFIPAVLVHQVQQGFQSLADHDQLWQGAGLFDFGDFQIHL